MNLDRLRVFLQIVDSGSMSAAARAVHLTQPALSRTLRLLEQEVGVQLFERRGRALVLTAGGRALVPRGRALLADSERLALETRRSAERAYFDLRVGTVDSVATYLFPRGLPALRRAFPALAVKLSTARTFRGAKTETDIQAFPVVEIDPGHGEPSLVPEAAFSYAVASNVATVKALVLAGFGVGELPDFMLSADERRTLARAQVPHDPDCGLFLVSAPHFNGATETRIADVLARTLSARLRR